MYSFINNNKYVNNKSIYKKKIIKQLKQLSELNAFVLKGF